jgi:hypothetical protein
MSGEHNELDGLAGEVVQVDALIAPPVTDMNPPPDTQAAPPVDRLAEAKVLIGILQPLIVMALPYIEDAPPAEWEALHQPIADCLAFYDVDVSKYLAHPLAGLAFAAVPLVMRGVTNWQATTKKPKPAVQLEAVPGSSGEPVPAVMPRA